MLAHSNLGARWNSSLRGIRRGMCIAVVRSRGSGARSGKPGGATQVSKEGTYLPWYIRNPRRYIQVLGTCQERKTKKGREEDGSGRYLWSVPCSAPAGRTTGSRQLVGGGEDWSGAPGLFPGWRLVEPCRWGREGRP